MRTPIGILSIAHVHADAYATILSDHNDIQFVGVADDNPKHGESFARKYDTEYLDTESLLEKAEGVIVCSPNTEHLRWVREAAAANVDVLCEKPLATKALVAEDIIEITNGHGVELGVAMPLRQSIPAQRVKAAVENGDLGAIKAISGTNRGKMPDGWFTNSDVSGGGAVIDHTVHIVDLVHWLTGERVTEVYAETGTRFFDLDVEDVNLLSMKLSDGTQFSLDGSWSRPEEWDFWGDATLEITGTSGVASVDCFDEKFRQTRAAGEEPGQRSMFYGTDPNRGMITEFARAVEGRDASLVTGQEGKDAVAVVEAVYESAHRNTPVSVNYE